MKRTGIWSGYKFSRCPAGSRSSAAGGTGGRKVEQHGTQAPLLSLERQILMEEEVTTPPGGASGSRDSGAARWGASRASDFYSWSPSEFRLCWSRRPRLATLHDRSEDHVRIKRSSHWLARTSRLVGLCLRATLGRRAGGGGGGIAPFHCCRRAPSG